MKRLQPKQKRFLEAYTDPTSPSFAVATKSGRLAGYKESYVRTLATSKPKWFRERSKDDLSMLRKAESNLKEFLSDDDKKIRLNTTKFVAERIGRDKWNTKGTTSESNIEIIQIEAKLRDLLNEPDDETPRENLGTGEVIVQE